MLLQSAVISSTSSHLSPIDFATTSFAQSVFAKLLYAVLDATLSYTPLWFAFLLQTQFGSHPPHCILGKCISFLPLTMSSAFVSLGYCSPAPAAVLSFLFWLFCELNLFPCLFIFGLEALHIIIILASSEWVFLFPHLLDLQTERLSGHYLHCF